MKASTIKRLSLFVLLVAVGCGDQPTGKPAVGDTVIGTLTAAPIKTDSVFSVGDTVQIVALASHNRLQARIAEINGEMYLLKFRYKYKVNPIWVRNNQIMPYGAKQQAAYGN